MDQYIRAREMTMINSDFKSDQKHYRTSQNTKISDLPYGFWTTQKSPQAHEAYESEVTKKFKTGIKEINKDAI